MVSMLKKKDEKTHEAQGEKSRQTASVNAIRVLQTLAKRPLTFSELLKETGFSKPVLTKHLKNLMKEGAIYKDTIKPNENSEFNVGKVVYRYVPHEPSFLEQLQSKVVEHALHITTRDWDEKSKRAFTEHVKAIFEIQSRELKKAGARSKE